LQPRVAEQIDSLAFAQIPDATIPEQKLEPENVQPQASDKRVVDI
jgi:hypothetical protein